MNVIKTLLATLAIAVLLVGHPTRTATGQDQNWKQGQSIGLNAGVCIREGPGFRYRAHTRVPEANWSVVVIDGPRTADGKTWYDTSRKEAGDPSGGTGWVAADGSDTDCTRQDAPSQPSEPNPDPTLPINAGDLASSFGTLSKLLNQVYGWWLGQATNVKWGVAFVAVVILVALWRQISWAFTALVQLVIAGVMAAIIWWVVDQVRDLWQTPWFAIVGNDAPDLALLLASIPFAGWLVTLGRRLMRRRG